MWLQLKCQPKQLELLDLYVLFVVHNLIMYVYLQAVHHKIFAIANDNLLFGPLF